MSGQPINIAEGNIVASSPQISGEMKHHYENLFNLAEDAYSRNEYELTVILASCACEMLIERTFRLLFAFQ